MNIIKIWNDSPSEKQLLAISRRIREGEIAIIPTGTLYAIAGDALNVKAIDRICKIKGINPEKTNLSIICNDISMASEYSKIRDRAFKIMRKNCPGAFTFLLPTASALPKAFKGRKTVGVRIPDSAVARELAKTLGNPLISTSIEYEDEDHAINPELIEEAYYNQVDMMIDGGPGSTEVSTIVDCTGDDFSILREGAGILEI